MTGGRLGLQPYGSVTSRPADGNLHLARTFALAVDWFSGRVRCEVIETELPDRYIGTSLLDGQILVIGFGLAKTVEVR